MRVARYLMAFLSMALVSTCLAQFATAQTPEATPGDSPEATGGAWEVTGVRELDIGVWYAALSPDGQYLAGVGAEETFCIWDVETLEPECIGEPMPIRAETIAWSPDGTAVAFALETIPSRSDSDIYVYERETGELVNLTDDGVEGPLDEITDVDPPIDDVPTWSPDSQQLAFARAFRGDGESATTALMRIDRAGSEPVEIALLEVTRPLVLWLPMYWLPDHTLVYSQNTTDIEDTNNGVWTVSTEGGDSPTLIVPGGEESVFGGPMTIYDVADGKAVIFAYWLVGEVGFDGGRPIFWLADLNTGDYEPLPALPEDARRAPRLVDASFSPDGSTVLLVTNSLDGEQLMALDVATGAITPVEPEPREERYLAAAPQWVSNNTVLLQRTDGPMLFTLAQADGSTMTSPVASPAASPVATDAAWQIAEERELNTETRFAALSPDGQQLAGVGPDDTICVWAVETLESECAGESLPIRPETVTWSPDGTAVAFALDTIRLLYESDIYVYELGTGDLVNLTDDGIEGGLLDAIDSNPPADDVPLWSPDSQQIVFARSFMGDEGPGSTSIMRIDRAGGEPVEVLTLEPRQPFSIWMPMHWMDDGTLVYSQASNDIGDSRNGIWTVSVEGGSPIQVAPGGGDSDIPGALVSDVANGKAIVYSYYLMAEFAFEGDRPIFWIVDLATGDREPLPVSPAEDGEQRWVIEAGFSPDGRTILLVTSTSDGSRLMVLDVATGEITPLQAEPSEVRYQPGAPQWVSNDTVLLQRREGPLLFTLVPTGDSVPPSATPGASPVADDAVWRIAKERELDIGARHVVLSPDGEWLAGVGPDTTLCIWEVTSLVSRCLNEQLEIRPETITWAPDSSAVAFSLDAFIQLYESDIYLLERQPWALTNLTDDGVEGSIIDGIEAGAPLDDSPAWSPDGQRIAFVRSDTSGEVETTTLMWIDREGGEPVELLSLDVDDAYAVWAPMHWLDDGTLLYSQLGQDRADPRTGLWRVGVDDGSSPLQLVSGSESEEIPWPVVSAVEGDTAIVYSYLHLRQVGFEEGDPLWWQLDLATGERAPVIVPPGDETQPDWVLSVGLSPDGKTAVLVVRIAEGWMLMSMDMSTGELAALETEPRDSVFTEQAPQWAGNDTVLLQRPDGPLLITLEEVA